MFAIAHSEPCSKLLRILKCASGLMVRERRSYYRHPTTLVASVECRGDVVSGVIANVSEGGLALRLQRHLPLGAGVRVETVIPSLGSVRMAGEIVWTDARGYAGVQFDAADENHSDVSTWVHEQLNAVMASYLNRAVGLTSHGQTLCD